MGSEPARDEVLRMLGYRRGARPSRRVASRLDAVWSEAVSLLAPRGSWRLVEAEATEPLALPEPTLQVALGVCTIGTALPDRVRVLRNDGDAVGALLFDAVGSAAVEQAADALNAQICDHAHSLGLNPAPRVSPGYGRWPVTAQRALLPLLDAGAIGVSLTAGAMMVPEKSVSFAVRLRLTAASEPAQRSRCGRCGHPRCRYRWEEP